VGDSTRVEGCYRPAVRAWTAAAGMRIASLAVTTLTFPSATSRYPRELEQQPPPPSLSSQRQPPPRSRRLQRGLDGHAPPAKLKPVGRPSGAAFHGRRRAPSRMWTQESTALDEFGGGRERSGTASALHRSTLRAATT
jgi:hypothetical protein